MKTLATVGAAGLLVAWFGASAMQVLGAEKRVRPNADRWNDNSWVEASAAVPWVAQPSRGLGCMHPTNRIDRQQRGVCATQHTSTSLFRSNDRALVLNRGEGDLAILNESWNGGTGNWSTASDWTPAGVPNIGDEVTIDSGGTDLVSLDISTTIASLVLGGSTGSSTLQNASGTPESLEFTGTTIINSHGNLIFENGSTLKFDAGLTVAGSLDLASATATITAGGGTFTYSSSVNLAGRSTLILNGEPDE